MNNMTGAMPMFGGPDTSDMTGKWINKLTGKEIMVRDIIMDDHGLNAVTNMGLISGEEFNNYVKCSDEVYDANGNVIATEAFAPNEIPTAHESAPSLDADLLFAGMGTPPDSVSPANTVKTTSTTTQKANNNSKFELIDKILSKTSKPSIKLNIEWQDMPVDQLNTLINFLDVSIEDIIDYLTSNFPTEEYATSVKTYVEKQLKNNV